MRVNDNKSLVTRSPGIAKFQPDEPEMGIWQA
jgi:hypothetical protein